MPDQIERRRGSIAWRDMLQAATVAGSVGLLIWQASGWAHGIKAAIEHETATRQADDARIVSEIASLKTQLLNVRLEPKP